VSFYSKIDVSAKSFDFAIEGLRSFYLEHSMNFIDQASKYGNCVWEMLVRQRPALKYAIADLNLVFSIAWIFIRWFFSLFWHHSLMFYYAIGYFTVLTFPCWTEIDSMGMISTSFDHACEMILYFLCMSLYIVIPVLVCWIYFLILASFYGLGKIRRILQWKHRLWLLQVRTGLCFSPQMGETETKEDRRARYHKNKNARAIERVKRPRDGRDKGTWKLKKKEVFVPQIGSVAVATALSNLANVRGIPVSPEVLNKIEDLVAYFVAIKDCTTTSGFLATTFLYLKTHYRESVAKAAMTYITEYLDATFDCQTGS